MARPLYEEPGTTGQGRTRRGCLRFTLVFILGLTGLAIGIRGGNPGLGLIVGGALGAWLGSGDRLAGPGDDQDARYTAPGDPRITVFVDRALLYNVIDRDTAFRLLEFLRRGMTGAGETASPSVPMAERPPAATPAVRPEPADRPAPRPDPADRPAPRPEPTQRPAARPPRPTTPSAPPVRRPAATVPVVARPAPRQPGPLAIGLRRVGSSARAMWKAFSADVAIHTVTYLGVLLLALVMFAFYGLGFYGQIISGERWRPWRPVVAAALPLLGFGVAALLRVRTGIVFTANAIGFLAALALPIALSSLFQDGAPWGPPDLDGPERWIGYAVVGVVSAVIFALAARRSTMYAYLVGPGLWTAAGALGLYLEDGIGLIRDGGVSSFAQFTSDGISWAQMAFVLGVMAVTLPFTRLARDGTVAPRIVRSAVVCLPVVAIFGGAFAALQGSASGLSPDAAPTVLLLATGAVTLSARTTSFAWDDAGERLRTWIGRALVTTGLVVVAAAWVATGWLGVEAPWIGAGLAVYAALVLVGGDRAHGGGRFTVAGLRLLGAIGMVVSIAEPLTCLLVWAAAAAAIVLADLLPGWQERWVRVHPLPATALEGSALIALLSGVAVFGGSRLWWGDAAGWVLLAISLAVAGARWAPARAEAVRGLSAWAIPGVASAVAVAAYRWQEIGSIGTPALGLHLLAAGAIVAVARIDWLVRLPIITGAIVPGALLALRWFDVRGSVIDASVLGVAGAVLLGLAVVIAERPALEADAIGHLLVWLAPVVGSPSDSGVMIGLLAVAVTHLFVAGSVDRGWWARALGLGMPRSASILAHAFVGVVTLPSVAVLASREIAWFAAERARASFVLLAAAALYAGFASLLRLPAARRMVSAASYVLAVASVGVAVPSSTALLVTTWSSAALFGWQAVRAGRPAATLPAWSMALAGSIIASARLGVSRADLHEPLFAAGVGLVGIGAAAYRVLPRLRGWAVPPLGLGLLVMPAALAFVIADQVDVAVFAGVAALVYGALIWLIRTGAFAPVAASMVGVGYAAALPERVSAFDHPLMWLPLAAVVLGVSAAQPKRDPEHWLAPVMPGLNAVWVAVLVLAGSVALDAGGLDRILLGSAALVAIAALRWRSLPVAYASLGLVAWSGAAAGPGWLTLALMFDALVVGTHATVRADDLASRVFAPLASALGVGAVVALGVWQQWSLRSALIAIAIIGILAAAMVVLFTVRRPAGRLSIWVMPIAVVAQGAIVTYAAIGWESLGEPGRFGPLAASLAAEAVLAGASALVWRKVDTAWASAVLGAAAYVALGGWRAWSVGEALVAAGVPALALGAAALGLGLATAGSRLRLWEGPAHGLAQASALGFLGIGLSDTAIDPAAVFAAVLAFEAITAGVIGTRLRTEEPLWAAAGLGLGAILAVGVWAELGVWPSAWLALGVGAAAAACASVAARVGEGTRIRLWRDPTMAASQVAWAAAPILAADHLSPEAVSGFAALALAVDSLFAASLARVLPASLRLRTIAAAMAVTASLLGVGAADPEVASALVIFLAAIGALMLIGGSYRDSRLGLWDEAVLVGGWVLTAGVPLVTQARVESDAILGAVLVVGGAGIVPASIVAGRWRAIYLGMVEWGLAVQLLGRGQTITDANLVVVPAAVIALAIVSIERLRARLLERPFSPEMHDAVLYVEIVAMATPLIVAAWPAYERPSLGHLGLLAAEASVLVMWALLTRVRRRLAWGVVGIIAVIIYPVARVLVTALQGGLSGGSMLAIGAVVALVLIVIGSLLERSRMRVGDVVRRLGEALEGWS